MRDFVSYVKNHFGPLLTVAVVASNAGLLSKGVGQFAMALASVCGVQLQ